MRLSAVALLLGTTVSTASASTSSATVTVQPAVGLLSEGTNTLDAVSGDFQLDTVTPTLTWAPQHTGNLEMDQLAFTVSLRQQGQNQGSDKFEFTSDTLDFPQLKVPSGVLREGTSYEWVVDTIHRASGAVTRSSPGGFHVGLLDPASWDGIAWLGSNETNLYRTDVSISDASNVVEANLYVCGLGYSQVYVNGAAASDALLVTSAWSNNARHNFFSWFNVTNAVSEQAEVAVDAPADAAATIGVGVALGHGWRDVSKFPRHDADWTTGDSTERVLRAQLRVTYANGTVTTAAATASDGSWTTTAGPVVADSVYDGETFDSRINQPGWSAAGYDAVASGFAAWAPAQAVSDGPTGQMAPWSAPPVAVTETLQPISVTPHALNANLSCAVDPEGQSAALSCPGDGNSIADVTFASYGTPTGSCEDDNLARNKDCDADISGIVRSLCQGKASCTVECDQHQCGGTSLPGGDPCYNTAKKLAVAVSCANPVPASNTTNYVVDFGRNLAGVVRLSGINEAAGTSVVMKHAEILQHSGLPGLPNPDPTAIYQDNLRSAKATDTFIASGTGNETYTPTMTYHGFRYVEISGLSAPPSVELLHFHSDVAKRAQANFSSPTLNRILTMAVGSQHSNMMTVPTDCDQRDERLGWMGDADLSSESMCLNFDCPAFFKSFLISMADELDASDGSLTDTVPWVRYGGRPGDASWTAAFPQYVYTLFKSAGDLDTARAYFPQVLLHLKNIESQASGVLGVCGMHTPYGDWCPPPTAAGGGQGPKPTGPYTSVFAYATIASQAAELAVALGENATELVALAAKVKDEFNHCFLKDDTYDNGVMTTDVLALQSGAAAAANTTSTTQKNLADKVSAQGNHFTTGIIGFKFLFDQLKAAGREDLALAVLEQTTFPSIGYEATNTLEPATYNLWELTDAPFEGTGMNSRNHHMFSSFSSYLQQDVAGLRHSYSAVQSSDHHDASSTNLKSQLIFSPASVLGLRSASISLPTRHGVASHSWQRHGGVQCAQAAGTDVAVVDCGDQGGVISQINFASLGPASGTCGNFSHSFTSSGESCTSLDFTQYAQSICRGKQRCDMSPEAVLTELQLADDEHMCFRTDLGEAPVVVLQATCSSASIIDASVEAPVATHERVVDFPAASLLLQDGKSVVIERISDNGATIVTRLSAGSNKLMPAKHVEGVVAVSMTDAGGIRVHLAGGKHRFRAAVV